MGQRHADAETLPELVVRITWRQWEDGYWEAWIADESDRPPQRVRTQAELERFLEGAWQDGSSASGGEPSPDNRTP
jgi:hypothetical protein